MTELFSKTLKDYKEKHSLTQEAMAEMLGISTRMYQYYERGTYDGHPARIEKYKKRLKEFRERKPKGVVIHQDVIPMNMTDKQVIYVPLVPARAYAGYLSGFGDEEYIEELPKEPFFMDREYKGKYMAFEVRGDSMDDGSRDSICERDIVLGREIIKDHWKNKLHIHKWNFIIVTKDDGILYKQIKSHDTVRSTIVIHSLNPIYEDREMKLSEIAQLFNVVQVNRKM